MSAYPRKADIARLPRYVRFVPIGDTSHSRPTEAVYSFRIVVLGLDLLLLLGDGLRLSGYRRRDNLLLRFLFKKDRGFGVRGNEAVVNWLSRRDGDFAREPLRAPRETNPAPQMIGDHLFHHGSSGSARFSPAPMTGSSSLFSISVSGFTRWE
jgi:hypothetical protein